MPGGPCKPARGGHERRTVGRANGLLKLASFGAIVLMLGAAAPARAGFDEGMAAAARGDYATAIAQWTPAAGRGHAGAQYNLGRLHRQGLGLRRDDALALEWYGKAAAQGHAGALNALGDMYRVGLRLNDRQLRLPRDFGQAARWYRKAAWRGHVGANFGLGLLYEQGGVGLARNDAEAVRWFHTAAQAGHAGALIKLGALHAEGRGVPRDDVLAHMWFNIAAARASGMEARVADTQREMIAYRLSPEGVRTAQGLARGWLARHGTE